ncbi:hypothetical protein Aconfl_41540 [Algoriphagus confluentis]|uniref:Uncharacterized protein n=1 Tax=Algoriphagus confluentis TaxID=1697556 RepID=A0ABQ6PU83_9BACT|nr:hypothetical protein Aconfl_41540 [Algoriphagus confluentis]
MRTVYDLRSPYWNRSKLLSKISEVDLQQKTRQ